MYHLSAGAGGVVPGALLPWQVCAEQAGLGVSLHLQTCETVNTVWAALRILL